MKNIQTTKWLITWIIVWVLITWTWTFAAVTNPGMIWSLFDEVSSGVYKLIWTNITTDSITADQLWINSVGAWELADNSVDLNSMTTDSVNSNNIVNRSILAEDIGNWEITSNELWPDSVGPNQLDNNADFTMNDLTVNSWNINLRDQKLFWNNVSFLTFDSNSSTNSALRIRDREWDLHGMLYGWNNGGSFWLMDWDAQWSYLAVKDSYTAFRINNSEKMRIRSDGKVWIWTDSPEKQLHLKWDGYILLENPNGLQSTINIHNVTWNLDLKNDWKGIDIDRNWNVWIGSATPQEKLDVNWRIRAADFLYSSDKRLKKSISWITWSIDTVKKLRWVNFIWKESGERNIWFIAQEIEEVLPELVNTSNDWMKSVKYWNMTAILLEAIKEQQKVIEKQSERMNELEKIVHKIK